MTYEDVREKVASIYNSPITPGLKIIEIDGDIAKGLGYWLADQLLAIKAGNYTLKELAELAEKAKDTRLAVVDKDQSLPENPYDPPFDITQEGWRDCIDATMQKMPKERWIKESK